MKSVPAGLFAFISFYYLEKAGESDLNTPHKWFHMEDLMTIIAREMGEYSSKSAYLNNFYMKLPDDTYEHGSYFRDLLVRVRRMDLSPIESGAISEEEKQKGSTDLALNQKGKDFLETIERSLTEERISIEEVKRLQRLGRDDFNKIKELHEFVFPAYIRLRRMGYSHFDLTG